MVFDLGGVLIDWDPRHLYRRLFAGDERAMEAFLADVCSPEWNARQDAGRPWAEAVESLAQEFPAERDLIVAFDRRWAEMLGGPIAGSVAILRELGDRGMPVYALSNWSAEKFPVARARFPFLDWFDGIVISGDVGIAKPDPRIFQLLLDRHGLDPRSTVYIDDHEPNIAAAGHLGMVTLTFRGAAELRAGLQRLGILPEQAPEPGPG